MARGDAVTLVGLDQVQDMLRRADEGQFGMARKALGDAAKRVQRRTQARTQGSPLKRRTGQLARSLRTEVSGRSTNTLQARAFADPSVAPYAHVHETGMTIRAKRAYATLPGGPFLAIPASDNQTASGVTRRTPRASHRAGAFVVPIQAPRARYAVMRRDGSGGLSPEHWLVKEVTIPPRLGMRDIADAEIPTLLGELSELAENNLRGGGLGG